MFSLSRMSARTSRVSICSQCLRKISTRQPFTAISPAEPSRSTLRRTALIPVRPLIPYKFQSRHYASTSTADEIIEEIQEQYATARDEFEIATEETEKKSVYAADDRAAARQELDNLKEMYEKALRGSDGEEVKRRVGQRIRELDNAVGALEKAAVEH